MYTSWTVMKIKQEEFQALTGIFALDYNPLMHDLLFLYTVLFLAETGESIHKQLKTPG